MKYDFDTVVDRRGTDSLKWKVKENELPMWVADMDFKTAPEIIDAMGRRLSNGVFGYSIVPDEWYDAYINWWKDRHGLEIRRDWLIFCTGVIPAMSSTVRKLATPDENVVVQTPVYTGFFTSIKNNGCRILESPLRYEDGKYSMDLEDLEKKLSDPQTSLMILCNPHNPIGLIWNRDTLAHIGMLAKKYNVTVISDEIHCDLTEPGEEYVPFASVSDECRDVSITCIAPTKTFNLAGLQTAAVCIPNTVLRHKVWRALNTDEVAEPNFLAVPAAIAAFEKGGEWLDELRAYISENRKFVTEYVKDNIPEISVIEGKATYLLWLDISSVSSKSRELAAFIREKTGLFVSAGSYFGKEGDSFLRLNIACPRSVCEDGIHRLEQGIQEYKAAVQ